MLPAFWIWGSTMIMHPSLILLLDSNINGRSEFGFADMRRVPWSWWGRLKWENDDGTFVFSNNLTCFLTTETKNGTVITLSSDTREWCDSGVKTHHFKGAQAAVQVLQVLQNLLEKRSSAETTRGVPRRPTSQGRVCVC